MSKLSKIYSVRVKSFDGREYFTDESYPSYKEALKAAKSMKDDDDVARLSIWLYDEHYNANIIEADFSTNEL